MILLSHEGLSALVMVALFIAALFAGIFTPASYKSLLIKSIKNSLNPVNSSLKKLVESKQVGYAVISIYLIILYNNLRVAAINLLLGITFIAPIAIILFNGYMVGAFLSYGDITRNSILLLPHGVVELTAIIYSSILGLSLGLGLVRKLRGKDVDLLAELRRKAEGFKWVVALLSIAAFIEVFITPLLFLAYVLNSGSNVTAILP